MGILERLNPKAQAFAAAKAQVRDAVGRVLEVGDEVLVITPKQLMRVASITPLLDPGAPPNAMLMVLVTKLSVVVPRDTGVEDLFRLRHQAEIGDSAIPLEPSAPGEAEGAPMDTEPHPADCLCDACTCTQCGAHKHEGRCTPRGKR